MTIIHAESRVHVASMAELDRLLDRLRDTARRAEPIGFDYETTGPSIVGASASKPDVLRHLPVGAGFAFRDGERVYVPAGGVGDVPLRRVLRYLQQPGVPVWAHNAPFEMHVTENVGVVHRCRWQCSLIAAWMAGWKLDGKAGLKLKELARARLGYRGPTFDDVAAGRDAADIPVDELAPYCANDAWLTLCLGEQALNEIRRLRSERHWELELRTLPVTVHMERTGVDIDAPMLLAAANACESEMVQVEAQFRALTTTTVQWPTKVREPKRCTTCLGTGVVSMDSAAGLELPRREPCDAPGCLNGVLHFKNGKPKTQVVERDVPTRRGADIGSDAQVARWLFDELGWWPRHGHPLTKGGRPSTKADHVVPFAAQDGNGGTAARLRLRYQALRKYASTYTRGLVTLAAQSADGRLHTTYKQHGTDTSRYSSSLPNISNLPSTERQAYPWLHDLPDIRAAFLPPPGWRTVIMDFSQIELRLLAHYTRDAKLLAAYPWDGPGTDLHQELMDAVGCQRREAKILRFSSMYMISPPRLALRLALGTNDWSGKYTPDFAQDMLDTQWVLYPGVPAYWEAAIAYAREHGYATTISGFKRPIRDWTGRKAIGRSSRQAVNVPIQGSAGAILKQALVDLYDRWVAKGWLGKYVVIQGQTYDEIITAAHPDYADAVAADLKECMVAAGVAFKLRVPLEVDGGSGANWSEAKG